MTMEDWAKRIDIILEAGGDALLHDAGRVSAELAKSFAESEFEKYRVIQDKLFNSDYDKFNSSLPFDDEENWKPKGDEAISNQLILSLFIYERSNKIDNRKAPIEYLLAM